MPRKPLYYKFVVTMTENDPPQCAFTVGWDDGEHTVVPGIDVGPFDGLVDIILAASGSLDTQLSLW